MVWYSQDSSTSLAVDFFVFKGNTWAKVDSASSHPAFPEMRSFQGFFSISTPSSWQFRKVFDDIFQR